MAQKSGLFGRSRLRVRFGETDPVPAIRADSAGYLPRRVFWYLTVVRSRIQAQENAWLAQGVGFGGGVNYWIPKSAR